MPNTQSTLKGFIRAYQVDSRERRETLIKAMRETPFVACVATDSGVTKRLKPRSVYLATDRIKGIFEGVSGVFVVDESFPVLSSEKGRELLEVCGVSRHVDAFDIGSKLSSAEVEVIEELLDVGRTTSKGPHTDYDLRGLSELLEFRKTLSPVDWSMRAGLLWESLRELLNRRGRQPFSGTYRWRYYSDYQRSFPARFMRALTKDAWIPSPSGTLVKPSEISIEDTSWTNDPILTELFGFLPPALRELADKIGLELDVLTALTNADADKLQHIKRLLGMIHDKGTPEGASPSDGEPRVATEPLKSIDEEDAIARAAATRDWSNGDVEAKGSNKSNSEAGHGAPPFISYVAVSQTDDADNDGAINLNDHEELLKLEDLAIELILEQEPNLIRAPKNQAGFDLYEPGSLGGPVRWIEVKAMSSSLAHRSVALSHTQFAFATAQGDRFWLYVVENVGSTQATVAKIRNPAGRARSFTFDRGWNSIAER